MNATMIRRQILASAQRPTILTPSSSSFRHFIKPFASEAGEQKSGHISVKPDEGILFFNSLLPTNIQWAYRWLWILQRRAPILLHDAKEYSVGAASPAKVVETATKDAVPGHVEVVEVLPRLKEGGAFLKFRYPNGTDPESITAAVRKHLQENRIRPWWNPLSSVRAGLVIGKPWVEDLFIFPSCRLRVEFLPPQPGQEAAEMTQEQLYSFFRPYGKLSSVISQPSDSKIVPRYAYLDFARPRKAIMAKNCLHGFTIPESQGGGKSGTLLRITYEKKERFGWAKDWIFNHPRIVIPLIAALIAGISYTIFDPLRTLSIESHITRAFHIEDNFIFSWFRRQSEGLINKVRELSLGNRGTQAGLAALWEDRKDEVSKIQSWLMESTDTFIVVLGPRGSGKKELVIDHALKHKKDAHRLLVIDCKPVQEARGDAATIAAAAGQVGYRPVFSWINNISGLMDLAAQGITGIKAGFSETLETQLVKIHNNTATALRNIALSSRRKGDIDANLTDDEFLEAHPEHRPVVVVDNFLHKNTEPGAQVVYDRIAQWAAELTTSNVAHVIFLTNDISFTKALSKALPDRVFRQIALDDCSMATAKRYVINHLDFDVTPDQVEREEQEEGEEVKKLTPSQKRNDLHELDAVIGQLGGRLTDLEFLARRIKAGESPSTAVKEIIEQSASEILKMFLMSGAEDREWKVQQAWTLVKKLSKSGTLPYNEVLLDAAFGTSADPAIVALEQAELITIQSVNGRPYSVKPGKPVYQQAFKQLTEDRVLTAKMDLVLVTDAIATANKSIDKWEQELRLLGELPKQPGELHARVEWLLGNVAKSQKGIEDLERKSAGLKKILLSEY